MRQQRSSSPAAATKSSKGKEKEKRTEKGRDGRKEKEATEGNATTAVHQFFKVFFPEQSWERLRIPTPFHEHLIDDDEEEEASRQVSLKGPSGKTWRAALTSDPQGLCFTEGWKDFARDHSLVSGHFLVFTYDGRSRFSVAVFCASGVEDKSALGAQPCNKEVVVVVKLEEEEEGGVGVDVDGTSEVSALPPVEGDGTTRKRVRQVNDGMENGAAPKRHQKKPEKRKPDVATVDSSEAAPAVVNKVTSKKSRQPVVISQRRPVTEEEKNQALIRAKEFKSKSPFAVQVMMESYVYVGFFLKIPCEFVRESLPRTSKKMTLWDPQGTSWDINYVYYNDRSVAAFSGGWGKFAIGNNLEKFDVCVFELFKEDNINVHIYRVVPEITPLIRNKLTRLESAIPYIGS